MKFPVAELIIAAILTCLTHVRAELPMVQDSGEMPAPVRRINKDASVGFQRTITLQAGGQVTYQLQVRYERDPDSETIHVRHDKNSQTAGWGITVEGGKGAWYGQGSFGLSADRQSLLDGFPDEIVSGADKETAWVTMRWKDEQTGRFSAVTFSVKTGDNKLYVRFQHSREDAKLVEIKLISLPGHVQPESRLQEERWVCTAFENISEPLSTRISLNHNPDWVLIFDRWTNHFRGFCAFLFDPEDFTNVSVRLGKAVGAYLALKPEVLDTKLILFNYDEHYRTPEEAYDELNANHLQWRKNLGER